MSAAAADDRGALSPVKQALLEIRELRSRLAAAESAATEALAVIGLGCRLPGGVHDEASLWRVLAGGIDTIGPIPAERWNVDALHDPDPDRPGTMWTREGGFLDDVAGFDAAFFGIAPIEATSMDPQQRILLEVAWHALEDAGIAPDSLAGSRTGVFVGVGNGDYGRMLFADPARIDAYAGSGGSLAVVAGRIAYVLGLQGPAMAVDTACSASLVALHLACQSLRSGECDLALVAGANLILQPDAHIAFTKARMMSRDGRCKTFDAAADGYGRGEGAVVLVLQRQRDAQAAGARVQALVRGSAVNQDGRSGGLTAPNGPAQEAVIRAALAQARLVPADIDAVEAHGTGTSLGDPIELQALGAALGAGRQADRPLLVSSCKTNFGHLEAAAGLVGVARTVASLRRRQVPPHLHLNTPNPLVDWRSLPLCVPTRLQDWPRRGDAPLRCGVSSFGFSGTNAHVILEEAAVAAVTAPAVAERPQHLLALSARDAVALRSLADAWRERLAAEPDAVADLCFSANTGRARLGHRLAVRGRDAAALDAALAAWLEGRPHPSVTGGVATASPPRIAFVFTGQGAQHAGMARALYAGAPAFRGMLERCAAVLDPLLGVPLIDLLYGDASRTAALDDTAFAQPALFAVEVALAALWRSWGIEPVVVLGHSLGEFAAACVAGVFPLEDALRVLVQRGRLVSALPSSGAMVSVQADEASITAAMADAGVALDVAAFNGEQQIVLSGARAAIDALGSVLDARGLRWKPLRISQAFHSALIEPALAPLGEALAGVKFGPARCAIVSNLHGSLDSVAEMGRADYWLRQMRAPVRFAAAARTLLAQGVSHVIEIGPHPVVLGLAAEAAPADSGVQWLPSLRRGGDDWTEMLGSLQQLVVDGARLDGAGFELGRARRRMAAPLMPFRDRRYWFDAPASARPADDGGTHVWSRLCIALDRQSLQAPIGVDVTDPQRRWAALDRLTVAHAATVLRAAGVFALAGDAADVAEVRRRLGASESYTHLLERWLRRLAERGELRADGVRFVADTPLPDPRLAQCQAQADAVLADDAALRRYLAHCGALLPEVIAGRESPLETLFPGGSFELAEDIYRRSIPMRYANHLATAALEALAAARGPALPLRVLEIGAGTGSTTAALAASLPAGTQYTFTDVTPVFLERARGEFSAVPGMRFAEFDLERDSAAQGFAPASFDLVVATNAVHATRDLRQALRSIRTLLAPGGTLLLVETTKHLAWFDISTGLIEGWQRFDDDLRDDNPLLPATTWLRALRDAGFDDARAWPQDDNEAVGLGQHLLAARVAGSAAAPSHAGAIQQTDSPGAPATIDADANAAAETALRERLAAASPQTQRELLQDTLRDAVASVLKLGDDQAPGRHDRLMDLGMDSLMAVQLRNRLGRMLGLASPLPATLMFDHPTIDTLASYLQTRLPGHATPTAAAPQAPTAVPAAAPLGAERVAAMSDEEIEALLLQRLSPP